LSVNPGYQKWYALSRGAASEAKATFASLLLTQCAPITYVAAQLGHSKATTTLQWYAHWLPTSKRTFVDALDEGAGRPEAIAEAADAVVATPPAPAQREQSGRRLASVPARHGTNRAPFPQVSKNPEREMRLAPRAGLEPATS
jgi:hypothetical protein